MANSPLRLIPASELGSLPPTERLGLTKFVAGGLNVVFGPSGCYKSFYVLDSALRLAQSRAVVYVAGEGVGGLNNRVLAWCHHHHVSPGHSYFVGQAVNLLIAGQVRFLLELLVEIKPVVVIFDTLARCIQGADENSAKDIGNAIAASNLIQRTLNCGIVWIHHTNKAERGERGSGAIRGAADNMIEIFPNGDGSIRVSCSKSKDEEHWVDEQFSFMPVLKSGVLVPSAGYATLDYSDQEVRILEFLTLATFRTHGAKIIQIINSLNIPERTIYRMLSHLKSDNLITQGKRGDPFFITDSGEIILSRYKKIATDTTEIEIEQ